MNVRKHTALIFMLTPQNYLSFDESMAEQELQREHFIRLKDKLIEPSSNLDTVFRQLSKLSLYQKNKILNRNFYDWDLLANAVDDNYASIDDF